MAGTTSEKKVLVGLSGGVDSLMAAYFLQLAGWQVAGGYLQMQKNDQQLNSVRKIAEKLKIDLKIIDCRKEFANIIVQNFLKDYQKGETPNPCVWCNPLLKFRFLLDLARKEKIEKVATGHYAQIKEGMKKGKKIFFLQRGKDKIKDQSYFLYRLRQSDLGRIIFPLGEKRKEGVKWLAKEKGLFFEKMAEESQDVCFLNSNQGLADFLKKNFSMRAGNIVDEKGKILGRHEGLEKYTLGQRKGIGISGGPFFVLKKDFSKNELVISPEKKHPVFWQKKINLKKVSWVNDQPSARKQYLLKIRYGREETTGKIWQDKKNVWQVFLDEAQWAPTKGQSVVVYDGGRVVGGGIIK